MNADRRHSTPRSETNDFIITAIALDTVSAFTPVPQGLILSMKHEVDQMMPVLTVKRISGEESQV